MTTPTPLLIADLTAWLANLSGFVAGERLFYYQAAEKKAEAHKVDGFAVITGTGGPSSLGSPIRVPTFQITCRATSAAVASQLAQDLFELMFPVPGLPRRMVALSAAWRANAIDVVNSPSKIGLDESKQFQQVAFNIVLRVVRLA